MRKFFLSAGLLFFSLHSFAGAANTVLKCSSSDKKTNIEGQVPGDFAEFDLKTTHAGKEYHLFSFTNQTTLQTEENAELKIVEDLDAGVYTISANTKNSPVMIGFELYAIPSTVKKTKIPQGVRSSFEAKVRLSSSDLKDGSVQKRVNCTTMYRI